MIHSHYLLIKKQIKYDILWSFSANSLYSFYLPSSIFLQSWRRSFMINRSQIQVSVERWLFHRMSFWVLSTVLQVWLSDNSTSVSFLIVLCLNESLTANSSNWEKRKRGREERKKIERFFSMKQWIWIIDKCCHMFRNLGGTVWMGL